MADDEEKREEEEGEEEEEEQDKGEPSDSESDFDSEADDRESSQFSESSEEEEGVSDTGLTENQNRLLYLISLYSNIATTEEEMEEWIRGSALMVLVYEGVVAQCLDYDYAPASMLVENRRSYFNISQEGKSDVDFLREEELINGLKLSSKTFQPVTCFQISEKGAEIVSKLSKLDRQSVQEYCFAPGTRDLLHVEWQDDRYWLRAQGYQRESTVTETEDVSYVSSAYVPQCLRHGGRPTLSNAHRAHECGISENNIRDELDEVITLNSVSIIVSEYVPFGANQLVSLNINMGSTERVQGGFFTAMMDEDEKGTQMNVPPGLTSINILDYSLTRHVNLEADIHFPEEPGIVQVEMFGCSVNYTGTCFYGMQIEAVLDRIKDNISLDHLSRLLVDVHQDSSVIIDSCMSSYQRTLMNLVFLGDAPMRDKVNLLVANEITPHLTAEEYMDKGEYENELKQVLGDTRAAFDISEHDTLIFGAHGLLVAGPNARHHEPLLCSYISFASLNLFVKNFFNRLFIILGDLKVTRKMVENAHMDPAAVPSIRGNITSITRDIIMIKEILGFIRESLAIMPVPPEPPEQAGRSLYSRLQLQDQKDALLSRANDLVKTVGMAWSELQLAESMANIVDTAQQHRISVDSCYNLSQLVAAQVNTERAATSLEVMQVILCGSLAFEILDRITGEWSVVSTLWLRDFAYVMMQNNPMVWFTVSMFIWFIVGVICIKILHRFAWRAAGRIELRQIVNKPIRIAKLQRLVLDKDLSFEKHSVNLQNKYVTIGWQEKDKREYGGTSPEISVTYDVVSKHMLEFSVVYARREVKRALQFSAEELKSKILQIFERADVFTQDIDFDTNVGAIKFGARAMRGDGDPVEEKLQEQLETIEGGEDGGDNDGSKHTES
eukprot:g706.t1